MAEPLSVTGAAAASAALAPVGHLLRSADFQRVLATVPRSRSTHFSVHHVAAIPSVAKKPVRKLVATELSTGEAPIAVPAVDESLPPAPDGHWLGLVVPKRHAKRAVTRNLLKRQVRAVMELQAGSLAPGLWVVRLKAPFDRKQFTSPASDPLRSCARDELAALLQRAAARR